MKSFATKSAGAAIAIIMAAGMVSAQTGDTPQVADPSGLNLPSNVQLFGKQDPNVRKPTAIVNDTVITGTDVDQRLAMTLALNNIKELPAAEREQAQLQMLRQLIDETLQVQEARANDITVTAGEIDQSFNGIAKRFNRTPEEMRAFLRSVGSSDRSLRRQIEGELAWNRLLRRKVTPFVNVGEEEVKAIIARLQAAQGTDEFHLQEIYVSATPDRAQEVIASERKMIEQMRGGAPFEYFARNFSEASTKSVGGDLGWIRLATLPIELQQAAQGMGVGQIAGPIEVPGGYSILYLVDKRQVLTADPRDAKLSLRQLTVRFPKGTTEAQAGVRVAALAKSTQAINGCGSVQKVATEIGADIADNDSVTIRQLPPQLQEIMMKLQIGQATQPFGTPEEVRVFVLCGRDDVRAASLPSSEAVQQQLEEQRVNLRAQRMLRDIRRDAIIEYR